jgi:hypothetical protein
MYCSISTASKVHIQKKIGRKGRNMYENTCVPCCVYYLIVCQKKKYHKIRRIPRTVIKQTHVSKSFQWYKGAFRPRHLQPFQTWTPSSATDYNSEITIPLRFWGLVTLGSLSRVTKINIDKIYNGKAKDLNRRHLDIFHKRYWQVYVHRNQAMKVYSRSGGITPLIINSALGGG